MHLRVFKVLKEALHAQVQWQRKSQCVKHCRYFRIAPLGISFIVRRKEWTFEDTLMDILCIGTLRLPQFGN